MSIAIRCPSCLADYNVNPRLAGKRVKCKACGGAIRVPAEEQFAAPSSPLGDILTAAVRSPASRSASGRPVSAGEMAVGVADSAGVDREASTGSADAGDDRADHSEDAAMASEASTAAEEAEVTPAPKARVASRAYKAAALIVILGFFGLLYILGREVGLWGDVRSKTVRQESHLTPEERLERDRQISRSNLVRIGQGLAMWARAHKGMYPARLAEAAEVAELSAETFRSPFIAESGVAESYKYLHVRSMGVAIYKQTVVAYDAAELALGQGANVLYGDGDVRWVPAEQIATEVRRSENARLGLNEEDEPPVAVRPGEVGRKVRKRD